MILASKKIIFIALFFVVSNEVKSTPLPAPYIGEGIVNWVKELPANVGESIVHTYIDLMSKVEAIRVHVDKELLHIFAHNCFSRLHFFFRIFDFLSADETTKDSVKFYFSSRKNPNSRVVLFQENKISLDHVDFNPLIDTVVISHGYLSNGKMQWIQDMKDAFLKYGEYNVIVVDWEKGSNTKNYFSAATTTQIVGDVLAKLFGHIYDQKVKDNFNADTDVLGKIYFVGHSLGSHIVARAANVIKEDRDKENRLKDWIVKRITGLDPAQPCFLYADNDKRLDEHDAEFVDVIHTNARNLSLMGLGMPERIGHYDFYPNGGQMQPGCIIERPTIDRETNTSFFKGKEMMEATICSHGRAYEFFTESILAADNSSCQFISHPWDRTYNISFNVLAQGTCDGGDCPQMGINSINYHPLRKGIYFVLTGRKKPYCAVDESDIPWIKYQLKTDKMLGSDNFKNLISFV